MTSNGPLPGTSGRTRTAPWLPGLALLLAVAGCTEERLVQSFEDEIDAAGVDEVAVEADDGMLSVTGDAGATTVSAQVDLVTTRSGEDKDEDAVDALHLELRDEGDGGARLRVWLDPAVARYTADVFVTLPASVALDVQAVADEAELSTTAGVTLDDAGGDVTITDAGGDVTVTDDAGELTIDTVDGDVVVDDGNGDLTVTTVTGDATIDDGAGDIEVLDVEGTVTIRDGAGDIHITNAGSVDIEEDSGGQLTID